MKPFSTVATVEPQGQVHLAGVPFADGTEVDVMIHPRRPLAKDFASAWNRVCGQLRASAGEIGDDEIEQEIRAHRAGR